MWIEKYQYFEPSAEVYAAYSVGKMSLAHFPYVNDRLNEG